MNDVFAICSAGRDCQSTHTIYTDQRFDIVALNVGGKHLTTYFHRACNPYKGKTGMCDHSKD